MLPRLVAVLIAVLGLAQSQVKAAPETKESNRETAAPAGPADPVAEKAWKEVLEAIKPPPPPRDWAGKAPTAEQKADFNKFLATASQKAAEKAHEFYTKFPNDSRAEEARSREQRMLQQAAVFEKQSAPPTEQDKIRNKLDDTVRLAMKKQPEGLPAVLAELEKGLRELLKEYPKEPMVWEQFILIAQNGDEAT